jgi:hypothetical protein
VSNGDLPQKLGGPKLDDDPVVRLLLSGQAQTFEEAEEMYLDSSLPEIYRLLASPLSNEELFEQPLIQMLYYRSGRGWEDSL